MLIWHVSPHTFPTFDRTTIISLLSYNIFLEWLQSCSKYWSVYNNDWMKPLRSEDTKGINWRQDNTMSIKEPGGKDKQWSKTPYRETNHSFNNQNATNTREWIQVASNGRQLLFNKLQYCSLVSRTGAKKKCRHLYLNGRTIFTRWSYGPRYIQSSAW